MIRIGEGHRSEGGSELMTSAEAARFLRVSVRYLSTLARSGDLPTVRLGKRAVRFKWTDLEAYVDRKRQ